MICYGSKKVRIQVWGDVVMEVTFAVMDAARPSLSVGELQRHGWNIHFGQHSYLERVNGQMGEETRRRLENARAHSLVMIRLFKYVLTKTLEMGGERIVAACDWPRAATGWQLPEVRELVKLLPHRSSM